MNEEQYDQPESKSDVQPPRPSSDAPSAPAAGPGVLTALLCERCGAENLVRVKGCWYCERCHYKFDCYGW